MKKKVKKAILKEGSKTKKTMRQSSGIETKPLRRPARQAKKRAELRVLILEDSAADAELMEFQLEKDSIDFVSRRVDTRSGFLQQLATFKPDLILADYSLPKFDALQALQLSKKMAPLTPFIIVTGSISEEIAVECMKQGADDYLLKDRLARLGEAVRHSLTNSRLQVEKMAAEEALRETNEIFRLFLKHSPIYVFIKDENIRPIYLSKNYEKMLGRPLAKILGKDMDELFPSELSRTMIADDKRILREGKPCEFIEAMNGRTYSTLKFPIFIQGKAKYLAGYTTDITERKQAEAALRESEERFRAQYQGSPIAAFTWQKQEESFVLKEYNSSAEKITRGRVKEFVGKSTIDLYGNRPDIVRAFHQCFDNKGIVSIETSSEHFIPGKLVSTNFAFIPPDLVMVHLEDVTERRQAEEKIRESEEKFRSIVENSSDQIFMLDKDYKFLSVNKTGADLFRKSPQEMIGKSIVEIFPENIAAQFSKNVNNVFHTGKSMLDEEKILFQGHELYFSTSLNPVKDDRGRVIAVAGIVRDITESKLAEEQIRASLLEKEVLLKEIHHRVKNNLQIISGLLTLQAAQINDERLQKIIKESQSRIWTMALIHQTLYQSGNLADIDMADYIHSLVGNLLNSHAQVAMPPTISFDLLPLRLAIDKAIPLALIVNELVTNTMKHAFPDGRPGKICISLQKCRGKSQLVPIEDMETTPKEGTARCAPTHELTVADDGVGLPAGFDPKNQKSLGLQLVTMLTRQLDGALVIESSGGTAIHITFSNNEKNKKQS
jgi:PAS domain S-box-containing protein